MKEEELYAIQERIEYLREYLNDLQMRRLEYEITKRTLKELKENEEILVPLGSGVFFNAKVGKMDKVFVNIGADVVVEKTIDETIVIINEQIKKIEEMIDQTMAEIEYWYKVLEEASKKK